ncbi:MAG TPA: MBL fold metallo-hydrolase [Dehalococcoidia bacterium]|nr:MBL fold metallo-hydrolase [Dehalococcoidia bacterium]
MWVSPDKFRVGNIDVTAISDGKLALKPEGLFKDVPREEWQAEVKELDANGNVVVGMNSLVFRSAGKLILLDTGLGDKPSTVNATGSASGSPELSLLIKRLERHGIRREDIDVVINTHAHPDHIGWNTHLENGDLVPTFPNAKYWMTKSEWDFYTQPRRMERYQYLAENLKPILDRGQFELADGETDVTPEVRIIPSPGHTIGHACIMIHSAQEVAMFLGDLMHHPAHLEHPEWVNAVDYLPQQTPESRRHLIREAYRNDAVLVACHSSYSGFGRIVNENGSNRYVRLDPPSS